MPLIVCHDGEVQLMTELMSSGENWTLCLFNTNITPAEGDTATTYTAHETAFTGYSRKTLTRSISGTTWSPPSLATPTGGWSSRTQVGTTAYGSSAQTWTCGTTGDTVYGAFILGASSGKLIYVDKFASPVTLTNTAVLAYQPQFQDA